MKLQLINEINILKTVVCFGSKTAKDLVLCQPKIQIRQIRAIKKPIFLMNVNESKFQQSYRYLL